MSIVRVRSGVRSAVWDPTVNAFVALRPGAEFDDTDPIVVANGWAFQSDAKASAAPRVRSVRVEQATANPGELRSA